MRLDSMRFNLVSAAVAAALLAANPAHAQQAAPQAADLDALRAQIAALSLGVGLWLAALTTKFRDFGVVAGFALQLWFYVTPVVYPLSKVPAHWRDWVALNPMVEPVEAFRKVLLGSGSVDPKLLAISLGATALALLTGLIAFQRVEKSFVDVV